jgi:hypothetical protein
VLGEWRALCEGGWTGDVPRGLPDDDGTAAAQTEAGRPAVDIQSRESHTALLPVRDTDIHPTEREPPQYATNELERVAGPHLRNVPSAASSSDTSGHNPTTMGLRTQTSQDRETSKSSTSLASLASFPSPPTHIPPPLTSSPLASRTVSTEIQDDVGSPQLHASPSASTQPVEHSTSEAADADLVVPNEADGNQDEPAPAMLNQPTGDDNLAPPLSSVAARRPMNAASPSSPIEAETIAQPEPSSVAPKADYTGDSGPSYRSGSREGNIGATGSVSNTARKGDSAYYPKGDYMDDKEFGVRPTPTSPLDRWTLDTQPKNLERSESAASAGSVAALRNRYSYSVGYCCSSFTLT